MRSWFDVQGAVLSMEEAANGARAPVARFDINHSAARCRYSVQCLQAIRIRLELRAVRRQENSATALQAEP